MRKQDHTGQKNRQRGRRLFNPPLAANGANPAATTTTNANRQHQPPPNSGTTGSQLRSSSAPEESKANRSSVTRVSPPDAQRTQSDDHSQVVVSEMGQDGQTHAAYESPTAIGNPAQGLLAASTVVRQNPVGGPPVASAATLQRRPRHHERGSHGLSNNGQSQRQDPGLGADGGKLQGQ